MSATNFYFHYQRLGKESAWDLALADDREKIVSEIRPVFTTVLDLSSIPDDADWTKVRYRGPFYADFDSDDVELAIEKFQSFLHKLDMELGFDCTQARLFATGGRGFHIEIPQDCFMPKVPASGTTYLAYIYREMAQSLIVDTLDLAVYTGKRGRMWRTTNVKRDNGNHKVPISYDEALAMTPELYAELVSEPRLSPRLTPPSCNTQFSLLFQRGKDKVVASMRGKKKRQDKANAFLEPWKKAGKTPPSIEKIMSGEDIAEGVGFQQIAMQLAIYATSVAMPLAEFLDRCRGLIENHVSDGKRYNTGDKRREELQRMWEYMGENTLYDFDTGPLVRMLKKGTDVSDLGVVETEDREDMPAEPEVQQEDTGDEPATTSVATPPGFDVHKGVRRGFFMNADGMFRKTGDQVDSICRATLRKVESFYDIEKEEFRGFEFDVIVNGRKVARSMLSGDTFASLASMKKFFVAHQLSFQGGDPDVSGLLDIMAEKAARNGKVYVYPREGFFLVNHPEIDKPTPVKVYLTQDTYLCSVPEDSDQYFRLRYKPGQVASSYQIDIHKAPELDESMVDSLHDMFLFSRPETIADVLGWFVACHYRSVYLSLFKQFPLLQIYGEAGAGKTQTVMLLAHLHWNMRERISVSSALSATAYALDAMASTSTSAPMIVDEFKPRELKKREDKYNKLKDVFKASYVGSDIGNRGTVNRNSPESNMALIKSKATAPIVFMGEAIEMETAIVERSVCVNFSKSFITRSREAAFNRLQADPTCLSALGRAIVEMGFALNLDAMRKEVNDIQARIKSGLPDFEDENRRRAAPRIIFNRAVIIHALNTLKRVLQKHFGSEFDAAVDNLILTKDDISSDDSKVMTVYGMSEISKVISRVALLSREKDVPWEFKLDRDYVVGEGWLEIRVEKSYDAYRRYCSSINDVPLFDNMDAYMYALQAYSPCIDKVCATSELREEGSTERIVRLDMKALTREGIQSFRQ